jgi:hypothetical protein
VECWREPPATGGGYATSGLSRKAPRPLGVEDQGQHAIERAAGGSPRYSPVHGGTGKCRQTIFRRVRLTDIP